MLLGISVILIGYLLGSFPSAYIVAKLRKGVDIREVGIGNMGAANTFREIGPREGIIVWALDVAKGAAAIIVAQALSVSQPWVLAVGFAALLGHNFPVYIRFKGGKGAAITMGILLVLTPEAMAITFALLAIPFFFTRHIFTSMCIVAPLLPLLIWQFEQSAVLTVYSVALLFFMGLRNLPGHEELRAVLARVKNRNATDHYDKDGQFPPLE
jgi:glycerol-3-phosphate acyltransferase PlsY